MKPRMLQDEIHKTINMLDGYRAEMLEGKRTLRLEIVKSPLTSMWAAAGAGAVLASIVWAVAVW